MYDPVPISRTGYNNLKKELDHLQDEELPKVRKIVAEARELGDLKENAEYLTGRERQGFIVGRIGELKGMLSRSDIIDCTKVECDRIRFGTVVTLLDLDTNEEITYRLLGPDEADFKTGSISTQSPIGRAILGYEVGEKVTVSIPRGDRNFEVKNIEKSEID